MGLHNVNSEVVRKRYKRSFELLPKALKFVDRAYIINNSDVFKVVAEKRDGLLFIKEKISSILQRLLK